jgi:hypothetical protein
MSWLTVSHNQTLQRTFKRVSKQTEPEKQQPNDLEQENAEIVAEVGKEIH